MNNRNVFRLLSPCVPYVDCGTAVNSTTHTTTSALRAIGLAAVGLTGTADITIRSEGSKRTAVQFNSQYKLNGYAAGGYGTLQRVAQWEFTSATSDTQPVLGVAVTCRPSYKIEQDFLTEIAARL